MLHRLMSIARNSSGMLTVGGILWLVYLPFVNLMHLYFGWHHLAAEATGIVLSHFAYYFANLYIVYRQRPSWPSFGASIVISGGGWIGYMLFQWTVTDKLGLFASWTEIAGVPIKTGLNVVFQQWFTFGKLARYDQERAMLRRAAKGA